MLGILGKEDERRTASEHLGQCEMGWKRERVGSCLWIGYRMSLRFALETF